MAAQTIKKRTRFFVAVEGESEQSFLVWLQVLAQGKLHIHLDDVLLGGGGFKSMLEKAVKQHARGCKISGAYKDRFLMVDGALMKLLEPLARKGLSQVPQTLEQAFFERNLRKASNLAPFTFEKYSSSGGGEAAIYKDLYAAIFEDET